MLGGVHCTGSADLHPQLLYNLGPHMVLQNIDLLVRERPVHAPIHDAVAAALAACLWVDKLVDLVPGRTRRAWNGDV